MSIVKNASPEIILLGADDQSGRAVPLESAPLPKHLPIFFLYTKKGPVERKVVDSDTFNMLYGSESLTVSEPYYNFSSRFAAAGLSYNASCMIQRIVPEDAGVKANCVVYMDVLKTHVVNYVRNSDGSLVPNKNTNDYEIDMDNPVIEGYRVKWVREYIDANEEENLGTFTTKPGTMEDDEGNPSTMYPLFEARASNKGAYYNNVGFSIGSLFGSEVDESIKDGTQSLPFKLSIFTKKDENSSPTQFSTLYGEPYVLVSFREKATNPSTQSRMDFERMVDTQFYNTIDDTLSYVYPDLEGIHFYRNYYEEVTKMFMTTEAPFVSMTEKVWNDGKKASTLSWYDFTTVDQKQLLEEYYFLNPFALMTSKKVKYFTIVADDSISTTSKYAREVTMSADTPVFLAGGSDGTFSKEGFEKAVIKAMEKYADENSEYQDLAVNVESTLWDCGYSLETKLELTNFIVTRKDTTLMLSTHDAALGKKSLNLSDTRSVSTALRTRLKLCPESTYYGTPVARAIVVGGTMLLRDGSTDDRVPLTYDLMVKTCQMMGAADGKWKRDKLFDRVYGSASNPGSLITMGVDIQPSYIPKNVKPSLWSNGLVWAQPFDISSYHFPAIQTIYEDDTSGLNNFLTMMALSAVTKINAEAWRRFTGTSSLSDGEFVDMVEEWLNSALPSDAFADVFKIANEVWLNDTDKLKGYSWQQATTIYSPNLRTQCTFTPIIRRLEDAPTETNN